MTLFYIWIVGAALAALIFVWTVRNPPAVHHEEDTWSPWEIVLIGGFVSVFWFVIAAGLVIGWFASWLHYGGKR